MRTTAMAIEFKQVHTPFWLLTIAVFTGLLLPALVQDGMFLDGVTYSAVSKNLANGIGTLWKPHYTKTLYPAFHEQPPLAFGLQALFFAVLGKGIYAERIYALLSAILTALGIVSCWRLFFSQTALRGYSWLPVLLWISIPTVFWAYKNNILENTLGVFTLFSVYFIGKAMLQRKIAFLCLGSFLVLPAFLTKGPVGLFPLATVLIYGLIFREEKPGRLIAYGLVSIIFPLVCFYLLTLFFPEAKDNIDHYFQQHLLPALGNKREILVHNRFFILGHLLLELTLPLTLLLFLWGRQYLKKEEYQAPEKRTAFFFLFLGAVASLPLAVTLKQRIFYLTPSLPFYVLGISVLIVPYLQKNLEGLSDQVKTILGRATLALLLIVLAYSASRAGGYSRDKAILTDIYITAAHLPEGTVIGTTPANCSDWALIAYMSRVGYLSLDDSGGQEYFIVRNGEPVDGDILERYEKQDWGLTELVIHIKRNNFKIH